MASVIFVLHVIVEDNAFIKTSKMAESYVCNKYVEKLRLDSVSNTMQPFLICTHAGTSQADAGSSSTRHCLPAGSISPIQERPEAKATNQEVVHSIPLLLAKKVAKILNHSFFHSSAPSFNGTWAEPNHRQQAWQGQRWPTGLGGLRHHLRLPVCRQCFFS